jgi:transposase
MIHFMQDGARIHWATVVRNWFMLIEKKGIAGGKIEIIEWPPCSPDLNPIENAWARMKSDFERNYPQLLDSKLPQRELKEEIVAAIQDCWSRLHPDYFEGLARSMVKRVKAAIEAEGWYSIY